MEIPANPPAMPKTALEPVFEPDKHRQLPWLAVILSLLVLAVLGVLGYQNREPKKQVKSIPAPVSETFRPFGELNPEYSTTVFNSPDELMTQVLGADYYTRHFQKFEEEKVTETFIKIGYRYSYAPYLTNYQMVLFFDPSTGTISDKEISATLLTPQEFRISPEEAQNIAKSQKIYDCSDYTIKPELYQNNFTGVYNRFVWNIAGKSGCPKLTSKNRGVVIETSIDVETGEVYSTNKNEPTFGL